MRNGFCLLVDKLPARIGDLPVDTRACTAIAVTLKLSEEESSETEKLMYMTQKLFKLSYEEALEKSGFKDFASFDSAIMNYMGGAPQAKSWKELHPEASKTADSASDSPEGNGMPDFDFTQDSGAICAAFRQVYHLSLDETCNLHWWEFLELFRNLPWEGNTFSEKRSIRSRKPEPKATPEQIAALKKAKRAVALKDTRSPEKKAKDRQAMFNALDL